MESLRFEGERDFSLLNLSFSNCQMGINQNEIMPKQVFCKGEKGTQTLVAAVSI